MDFDGDAFTTWLEDHGENPDNWPLPEGQAMTWDEWAKALSAEAVKCGYTPDVFPWSAEDRRDMALTCWFEDWFSGKKPAEVVKEQQQAAKSHKPTSKKEAARIVRAAKTGKIQLVKGIFLVHGLKCQACGGSIVTNYRLITEESPDGPNWFCQTCGDVDQAGRPSDLVFKADIVEHNKDAKIYFEGGFGFYAFFSKAPCPKCGKRIEIDPDTITEDNPNGTAIFHPEDCDKEPMQEPISWNCANCEKDFVSCNDTCPYCGQEVLPF